MNSLFKIVNLRNDNIPARHEGEQDRPKLEVTLRYFEPAINNTTGKYLRYRHINISLLDSDATSWNLPVGQWLCASINIDAFQSRTDSSRWISSNFLDLFVPVDVTQL